ncbi:MAG: hypothetical protein KDC48_21140, partial [Planctomycetes bacterium]|nr:hypothetical protein [Planctomycetota bacterium]
MSASAPLIDETSALQALELRSRGLDLLLSRIEFARWREPVEEERPRPAPGKVTVLDLGAPYAANVAFLNAYRCRLYFGDAYRQLAELGRDDAQAAVPHTLPLPADERVHAVFAWDLVSFLDSGVVAAIAAQVARHATSGT